VYPLACAKESKTGWNIDRERREGDKMKPDVAMLSCPVDHQATSSNKAQEDETCDPWLIL